MGRYFHLCFIVLVLISLFATTIFPASSAFAGGALAPTAGFVTKTDTLIGDDGDGKADPGEIIEYTVTIPNVGTDATGVVFDDNPDANTTFVNGSLVASPVAVNDTFPVTVLGNVSINSASLASPFSVTANDFLGLNPAATITAFDATTVNGGQVTMTTSGAGMGRFTYNPPPGFEGTDTFTYTLTDNANVPSAAANRTATVSIPVSGMVWFINNGGAGCTTIAAGCGRLSNPFSTLAAFNSANGQPDVPASDIFNPAANDNIFMYESGAQYTGAITLLSAQKLIGQDATASLSTITGLTPPMGSPSFPAMNSGNGTVTNIGSTVTLNTNTTVRGLQINSTTSTGMTDSVAAITGVSVSEVRVTTTTGAAVNLSGTGGTFSFISISSNGAANGISLSNTTGSFTVTGTGTANSGGTIQNTTGDAISLTNTDNVSFDRMNIQNPGGSGVNGTQVTNFTFTNSTVNDAGDGVGSPEESALAFNTNKTTDNNLNGTLTITGNMLTNSYYSGLDVQSGDGTITQATVSNNTITNTTNGIGINFVGSCTNTTCFRLDNADINQNNITNTRGHGIQMQVSSNTTGTQVPHAGLPNDATKRIDITNNSIDPASNGTQAIAVVTGSPNSAARAKMNFLIECNGKNTGGCSSPTAAGLGSSDIGTVILVGNNGYSDMVGTINNNIITATHTVGGGGANGIGGGNGVSGAGNLWTPDLTLTVTNNVISGTDGNGILLVGRGTSGIARFGIRNNNVAAPLSGARPGIRVDAGNASSADDAVCLDISGNTTAGSGSVAGIGLRKQGTTATTNDFSIEGMAATSSPGVETFVGNTGQNPGSANGSGDGSTTGVLLISAASGFSSCSTVAMAPNGNQVVAQNQTESNVFSFTNGFKQTSFTFTKDTSNTALAPATNTQESKSQFAPLQAGGIVSVNVGTLPVGKSVIIKFQVTVNGPSLPLGTLQISNQGTVSGSNFSNVMTDDPGLGGTSDATITPVDRPDTSVSSITRSGTTPTNASSISWMVTFADAVTSLTSSNFTLVNGGLGGTPAITGVTAVGSTPATQWTVTASTGTGDGTLELSMVNDTGLSHDVTNQPFTQPSNGAVYTIDRTPPTTTSFTRQAPSASLTNADTLVFRVTFSEAVTGVGATDFTATGTTAPVTNIAPVSTGVYDVTVSGGDLAGYNGAVGLNFSGSMSITDQAGNALANAEPSTDETYTLDNTAPTILSFTRFDPATSPTNADQLIFNVLFSEQVAGIGMGDFAVNGTTTAGITGVGIINTNGLYQVTVSGGDLSSFNGTVGLNFSNTAVMTDLVGNAFVVVEPGTDETYTVDNNGPTVTINQAAGQADPTGASPINFTVTFSEPVTGFATGDVTLGGSANPSTGTITEIAPNNGTTYNVAVSGMSGSGTVTASIALSVAQDTAGNSNAASTSTDNTVMFDTSAPTVTINQSAGQVDPSNTSPINFTVVFSEPVTGFATGDVTLGGSANPTTGTVTEIAPNNGTTYNVAVSGMTGDGTVIASIGLGAAQDTAGNSNAASTSTDNTVTFDGTGPTVTINQAAGQADPNSASPVNFTVVFSEAVTGFTTGDVTFSGTANATTAVITEIAPSNGTTFNVAVSGMTNDGTVIASMDAGVATDTLGNGNAASTSTDNTVTFDTAGPTVTINQASGQSDPTNTSSINFTVVFSEPVIGFATGDVALSGTASPNTGTVTETAPNNGTTYNVAVSGMTGDGTVIASLNAGVATDAAGNGNAASTSTDNTVTYDGNAPTVTINQAAGQAEPTSASPVNFTVVFSEPVTGFAAGDVTLSGTANPATAAATEIAPNNGTTYNVAVSGMTSLGTVTASIPAGAANDAAGNGNAVSTSTDNTITYTDLVPPTVVSSVRADPNPTSSATLHFTVTFSEPVTGVDNSDFALTTTGVSGSSVAGVSGSGNAYTVTVNKGTGSSGTVRLDVLDNDSIRDAVTNPLGGAGSGNGDFTSGETYTISIVASVQVAISGTINSPFTVAPQASQLVNFAGVNTGAVNVASTNALPILPAERVVYNINNTSTSFSEMIGLPESLLDTTYWMPWYNNVDLDTQLRFANASASTATVHVYIGGQEMTGSPFTLTPSGADQAMRVSFPNVNSGPVQIVSNVPIVAAERLIYKVNGVPTSFSEMIGIPESQLDTTYWMPWYNNVNLDTQVRIANVTTNPASITVTIGGVAQAPINLPAGQSTGVSFSGVNSGPVKIESNVNIVASQRVIYKVNNTPVSLSEMMGLPESQADTTYWMPLYNNVNLDSQLRLANISPSTASVRVFIGGTEVTSSPISVAAGTSTQVSFAGSNNGPVQIVSNVPIVVTKRMIYKVNHVPTSFFELMGLPDGLLDTSYWVPWHNNVNLDTKIRVSVP